MTQSRSTFAIDPTLRPDAISGPLRRFGRAHIPGFLAAGGADRLHGALEAETGWVRSTRSNGQARDLPVQALEALDPARQAAIVEAAHAEAARGFHYLFDTIRISDVAERGEPLQSPYDALFGFLNGPDFLGFIRAATGERACAYVDAQATRYRRGHYLTCHDDHAEGKERLYAYVLNLTPRWQADWGGLLAFIDGDGHVAEAYAPAFNALNLFKVPHPHAVTYVAPFAGGDRLSVTGWIRASGPG